MVRKRRGRGEGGVYKRADGTWCGSISLGFGGNGKRRRRVVYGSTKREVLEKLDGLRQDARQGLPITSERLTLAAFLDRWLENDVRPNRAPGTYKCYSNTVRLHIKPLLGGTLLTNLTADQVAGFYASLETAVPPRTRELTHSILHRALNRANQWRLIGWNPCSTVERPKNPRKEQRAVRPEEAKELLKAAKGHRLEALFVLAVTTGMRQGELFGMQWRDIDLPMKRVKVLRSLEELDGNLRLKEPKSQNSRRTIELTGLAVDALSEHRKRMLVEGHFSPDRPVFPDTHGGFLRKSNFIRSVYSPLRKAAGLGALPFHGWRHFHASYLIENGTNPKVLQERLGHADVATTLRLYVHTHEEAQRHAADQFDTAFAAVGKKTNQVSPTGT
jgi:integrase